MSRRNNRGLKLTPARKAFKMLMYEAFGGQCPYCFIPMRVDPPGAQPRGRSMTVEHITPRSRGGNNRFENLMVCCSQCNNRRGNRSIVEFLCSTEISRKFRRNNR